MYLWYSMFVVVLCLPVCLPAQVITASDEVSFRRDDIYELAGELKGQVMVYRYRSNKHELLAFDERMKLRWEKEIFPSGNRQEPIGLHLSDSLLSLVYLCREKEGGYAVRVERYDSLARVVDTAIVARYPRNNPVPNPEVVSSEDENILLVYDLVFNRGVDLTAFHMGLMEPVWERGIAFENPESADDFRQAIITNGAELFLIFDRNNRRGKREEHHLDIFHLDYATDLSRRIIISLLEKLTIDAEYAYDELNDRIVSSGFYSDEHPSRSSGFFYLNLSPHDPESRTLVMHPFPETLIGSILATGAIHKEEEVEDLFAREIILRRDGGLILVGEITRMYERQIASSGRMVNANFSIDYYYEDVLLLSIHPTGERHWESVLHKRQFSQDDNGVYSSFFLTKTPVALHFIFNDEIRFENTVSEYVVNGLGQQVRNSVMSTDNQKLRLRFPDALQISANEIIVPSDFRNKLRLVRIRY